MKGTILLSLLLLSASVLTQTPGPTASCITDPAQQDVNHFLVWLKTEQSDAVLSTPQATPTSPATSWAICDKVWSANGGTCCNVDNVKKAFDNKAKGVKESWQRFIESLKKVREAVGKIKHILGTKDEAKAKFAEMKSETSKYNMAGLTEDQAAEILNKINTWETDLAAFKEDGKQCFEYLLPKRGVAFCYGCSGHGFTYFSQGPIFNYKSGTCNEMVTKCAKAWKFILHNHAMAFLALQLAKKRNGGTGTDPKTDPAGMFFKGKAQAPPTMGDIASILDKCASGTVSGTCTQEDLDKLCTAQFAFGGAGKQNDALNSDDLASAPQPPARLLSGRSLQTAGTPPPPGMIAAGSSNTAELSKDVGVGFSSAQSLDFGPAGGSSSTAGYLLLNVIGLCALLVTFLN